MKGLFTVSLILCFSFTAGAQTSQPTGTAPYPTTLINSIVQSAALDFMKDSARVGLSIGIYHDGRAYTFHYGSSQKGKDSRPTDNTIYEIGSISKTFTGLLLAKAIADKKISLDDDVTKYLQAPYPNLDYKGQPVKIIHLANHTSGLPPFLPDRPDIFQHSKDSIPFLLADLHKSYTKEQFLKDLHGIRPDTIPGFKYKYSNTGGQLLGFILENVYHKTFEQLVQEYITAPLDMKRTHAVNKAGFAELAKGYDANGVIMPYMPALMGPSGGIYSSLSDMLRYVRFQLKEENGLVRFSHTATQVYTDSTAIGLFWRINRITPSIRKIWHTGGTFGFSSYCVLYPDFNTGIILLSNEFDMTSQGELVGTADKIFEALISAGLIKHS
ncbi:beta-lactamase family protein [Chitinophaga agrisoli]|uniref:Beta-lactamase n=1 Tax=Chitinophaga agrisoli TaxID=2607653 RepID=A0A5B2VLB6_9BACT|nr:serine hydrolase domain-containing protein [Chitinophaga agrisoli]KAA2239644.1 beta-lactamase family protein [Chitinophaga agrisoli]